MQKAVRAFFVADLTQGRLKQAQYQNSLMYGGRNQRGLRGLFVEPATNIGLPEMAKSGRFAGFSGTGSRQSEPDSGLFLLMGSTAKDRIHGFSADCFWTMREGTVSGQVIYLDYHCVRGIPDIRKFFIKKWLLFIFMIEREEIRVYHSFCHSNTRAGKAVRIPPACFSGTSA
jgi:hypothetical protein